jgi:hypothetical protein
VVEHVIAIDGHADRGLHGALEVDLVHLVGGPGVAALLALCLDKGGDGHLKLGGRHLTRPRGIKFL